MQESKHHHAASVGVGDDGPPAATDCEKNHHDNDTTTTASKLCDPFSSMLPLPPSYTCRIRGGRPSSDVWDHINRVKDIDGRITQTCNYCGTTRKSVQCLASQWALHLVDRCEAVDVEVSVEMYWSRKDTVKGVKEAGERRGLHLNNPTQVAPAIPNTRNKTARNAVTKAEETAYNSQGGGTSSLAPPDNQHKPADAKWAASFNIWDHVSKGTPVNGLVEQTCNYCGYTKKAVQLAASNWAVHLVDQCRAVDPDVAYQVWDAKRHTVRLVRDAGARRGFVQGKVAAAGGGGLKQFPVAAAASNSGSIARSSPLKKPRTYHVACDPAQADRITLAIMEFLTGCAISVMVVESAFFINLLQTMNETYVKKYLPRADVFKRLWLPKLYESVNEKLNSVWRSDKDSYLTLASDVFRDEQGKKVLILTEAKAYRVAFRDWLVEGEERQTNSLIAQLCMDHMVATAGGDPAQVEQIFGAVCTDVTIINPSVGRAIEDKYPKVFFNGCRSRCGELLCRDILSIPQIEMLVKNARTIINFVRSNETVRKAYGRHMHQHHGAKLVCLPDTGIVQVDQMLESLLGPEEQNIEVLNALVVDPEWSMIVADVSPWSVAEFVALISDVHFFNRVKCIRNITQPLSVFTTHLNQSMARVSWLLPLFEALEKDLFVWCDDTTTGEYFSEETVSTIKKAFERRWKGTDDGTNRDGSVVGLYAPQHLLAVLLDPTTTLNVEELNRRYPQWYPECRKVLKRFFDENTVIVAKTQLYELVNQTGSWGDEVAESQSYVAIDATQHRFQVQMVAAKQLKSIDLKPHLLWKVSVGGQFPLIRDIALRLLTMSTQCSHVEKVCQIPKIVNSKASDRLKNGNVKKLIYCYVNLRLLKNVGIDSDKANVMEDFLMDAIFDESENEEEELGGQLEQGVEGI